MMDYNIYILSGKEKTYYTFGLLFALGVCSFLFYHHWVLLLLFPGLYSKGKSLYGEMLKRHRKRKLLKEFRDFLFSLSGSFATGKHMKDAMNEAGQYLTEIYGDKCLLSAELQQMLLAIEGTGQTDIQVLSAFAGRADLDDIYTFCDVFHSCRNTGGDMILAVNKAALVLSEKISLEQEISTMFYQRKLEGRLISAMPFLMLFFLQFASPGYLDIMYTTLTGRLMMTCALGLIVGGYLWMERMTDVEC